MSRLSSMSFLIILTVSVVARAEVPLKSKAQLQDGATHIVVGKVQSVYSVTAENDDWVDTKSVAEIVVQRVEKGGRIQTGDLVYGRFWNKRWVGKGNPDPFSRGHIGPKTDELVRVYLVRTDGGYDVILPNGFEDSPASGPVQAKTELADFQGTWSFVYYEEKGVVEEPGTKQFVIDDNRLDFRAGGQTRVETTVEVDVAVDFDGDAFLAALDCSTGREIWRTPRPAKSNFASPIIARVAGRDQLLIGGSDLIASYDPASGKELWKTEATTETTCGTVVWTGNLAFGSGGFPTRGTFGVRADGSGQVVWKNNRSCYEQSMLAHDGYVYAVDDRGIAHCWKAEDGSEMWSVRLGGRVSSSPVLAGANIYVSNEEGTTYVFEANPREFKEVARNELGNEAFATPAICGSRIYLRVADTVEDRRQEFLYCIGKR